MAQERLPYDGPLMSLTVWNAASGALTWSLEIRSTDAKGLRPLGYKAEGHDLALAAAGDAISLKVHDELRDVWTEMPVSHRLDVRQAMRTLLGDALTSLNSVHGSAR